MKKWSKIIAAVLVSVVLTGSLAACGNEEFVFVPGEDYPEETPAPTAAPTEKPADNDKKPEKGSGSAIVSAEYPVQAERPESMGWGEEYEAKLKAWSESRNYEGIIDYSKEVKTFYDAFASVISAQGDNENIIYSPINIYMALAMLAEVTDGETRAQILKTLGTNYDDLRNVARSIWLSNYSDDGVVTSTLANSLWLRDDMPYNASGLSVLRDCYYASAFSGTMGSPEYNALIQKWLNDNTGNLLTEQASGIEFSPSVVLALASTIYFKAPWLNDFYEGATEKATFHGTAGDKEVSFMHKSEDGGVYYGKGFSAYYKSFAGNGGMWFILPDEGKSASEILKSGEYEKLMFGQDAEGIERKSGEVNLTIPKFDVSCSMDLIETLKKMGITDVCDSGKADFSPIMDLPDVCLDEAIHAARVKIDEEGVEAAAFTVMMMKNTAIMVPQIIDFTVDRPFLFVMTDQNGVPTFVGTVNNIE